MGKARNICQTTGDVMTHEIDVPADVLNAEITGQYFKGHFSNWMAYCVYVVKNREKLQLTDEQVQLLFNIVTTCMDGEWPQGFTISPDVDIETVRNPPPVFLRNLKEVKPIKPRAKPVKKEEAKSAQPPTPRGKSAEPKEKTPRKQAAPKKAAKPSVTQEPPAKAPKPTYKDIKPFLHQLAVYVPPGKNAADTIPELDAYQIDQTWQFICTRLLPEGSAEDTALTVRRVKNDFVAVTLASDKRTNGYMTKYTGQDKPFRGGALLLHAGTTARKSFQPLSPAWTEIMQSFESGTMTQTKALETAVKNFCPKRTVDKLFPAPKKSKTTANTATPMSGVTSTGASST